MAINNPNIVKWPSAMALADSLNVWMDTLDSLEFELASAETPEAQKAAEHALERFKVENKKLWQDAMENVEAAVLFVRKMESSVTYARGVAASYQATAQRWEKRIAEFSSEFAGYLQKEKQLKLETPLGPMRVQRFPKVLILNPLGVPDDLKTFEVRLSGSAWLSLRSRVEPMADAVHAEASSTLIEQALEAGRELPGVARMDDNPRLVGLKTPKGKK